MGKEGITDSCSESGHAKGPSHGADAGFGLAAGAKASLETFCPSSLRAQLNSRQKDKPTRNMGLEGDHPSSPGAVPAASGPPPPRAVASSDQVQAGQTADAHHRPSGLTAGTREAAAGRLRKSECRRGTLCNRAPRSQTTRGTHRGIFVVQRIAGFYSQEPLAP